MSKSKLSIQTYFNKMKTTQENLLNYLENDKDLEENYTNLTRFIKGQKILKNTDLLKSTLYIIRTLINYHHHNQYFFSKIEKIILFMKEEIKQSFSNYEIFNIFKRNKLILLFLFEEKIIVPDKSISFYISTEKYKKRFYPQFFYPEFKELFNEKLVKEIESENKDIGSDEFLRKRKIGQNDSLICEIIRKDSVEEYIQFFETSKNKFFYKIDNSIYETNLFLLQKKICSLMDYAVFFGSMKIIEYSKSKLNSNLWINAVHSQKEELLNFLKENISMNDKLHNTCIIESVKCHHMNILNYFRKNFEQFKNQNVLKNSLNYYNFIETLIYKNPESYNFYQLCDNDYYILVENQLKNKINSYFWNNDEIFYLIFYTDILFCGVRKGHVDLVKLGLSRGNFKINDEFTDESEEDQSEGIFYIYFNRELIHEAVRNGNIEILQLLLTVKDIEVNKKQSLFRTIVLKIIF